MLPKMQNVPESKEMRVGKVDQTLHTAHSDEKQSAMHDAPAATPVHELSGMDFQVGLRRAMGMQTFYLSMLQNFVDSRRGTAAEIRSALKSQDLKKAEFLSHSLFGMSAQIGAISVPQDAQALEQAINAGQVSDLELLLDKLDISLGELVDELEHYLLRMSESP